MNVFLQILACQVYGKKVTTSAALLRSSFATEYPSALVQQASVTSWSGQQRHVWRGRSHAARPDVP